MYGSWNTFFSQLLQVITEEFFKEIFVNCIMFRYKYVHQWNIKLNKKSDLCVTILDSYDFLWFWYENDSGRMSMFIWYRL